jgi:hypothetical protein
MRVFLARLLVWGILVLLFTWVGVARLNDPDKGWGESMQRALADAWSGLLWGVR